MLMPKSQLHDDMEYYRRSSSEKLKFIFQNKEHLLKRRNGEKHYKAMQEIAQFPNHNFRPKQMSYIDDVYEMVMAQLGLPSYRGQKSKYGINLKC